MQDEIIFEEKQHLGSNKWALLWRMALALFCFVFYYWSENPKPVNVSGINIPSSPVSEDNGVLFFAMGVAILLLSIILNFVLHVHTTIINNSLIIDGLWTSRKVKIDLSNIVAAEITKNNNFGLNPPVYNLHFKNKIRFFTQGNYSVEITDKDGLKYSIGSQKADTLLHLIQKSMSEKMS